MNEIESEAKKMCLNRENYVVQANDLISGKQSLNLNAAKLFRIAIMNVVKEDTEFCDYRVSVPELAALLEVSPSDLRHHAEEICMDLLQHPVQIKQMFKTKEVYIGIPIVSYIKYDSDNGFSLRLNDLLKPYLINLKKQYTQIVLESLVKLKSVYSIRLFELLNRKQMQKVLPLDGVDIVLTVDEIKIACDCPKSYEHWTNFKRRILDAAREDINKRTQYTVSYTYIKTSRVITALKFHLNTKFHETVIASGQREEIEQRIQAADERVAEKIARKNWP